MATATRPTNEELDEIGKQFDPPLPEGTRVPRAPSLKRPDGLSDTEWAIMKASRNEDVHKRINDFLAGNVELTPEEAAVLLDIVGGVSLGLWRDIRKLREGVEPKIAEKAAMANTLHDTQMRLFRVATGRADA